MAEHTLYGKRKLCYTEVTDFTDFQGIGRDPLYKRFDSVYSVVEKNVEPQYRDFLAHPIYSDEDQIYGMCASGIIHRVHIVIYQMLIRLSMLR